MPPAARVGDQTQHGTPLTGVGSATVTIDGRPAWLGWNSIHSCPVADGPKPHAGGPVAVGSSKVWVEKQPAVRQGDRIVEAGPPNGVAVGTPQVQFG